MPQSREMAMLDTLTGTNERLVDLERWHFSGDRPGFLRSLVLLRKGGFVHILLDGQDVPDWQLQAWARTPNLVLPDVIVSLGDRML